MIIRNIYCDRTACRGRDCWRHICSTCGAYTVAHARTRSEAERLVAQRAAGNASVAPHECGRSYGTSVSCLDREIMFEDWLGGRRKTLVWPPD